MLEIFFKNEAKEIVKKYLFWTDFLEQEFSTIDELKEKLQTIKDTLVYQGEFKEFYLTQEEAQALGKKAQPITIEGVLSSDTYPLYLIERLQRVTSYSQSDLKHIPKKSEVVWLYSSGVLMHFVLKDGRYIYPKDYPVNNPYRYGYMIVFNQHALKGVYDVDSDNLKIPFEYSDIELFGNLAQLCKDGKTYEVIDLDTDETVEKNTQKILPNITDALKDKLNLSKVDLEDYITLFDTAKTEQDLVKMGLWNVKVGVLEVPSGFGEIIEENTGTIAWAYPNSADMFDMSVELPVVFKKKNGEEVTLGIKHEDMILEDRTILNDVVILSTPAVKDERELSNWLKIKNRELGDVDFSNNSVDDIIALSSPEFNELVSLLGNDNINMLLIYLKTVDEIELAEFFLYLEGVKLDENVDAPSAKEQFLHMLDSINAEDLDDKVKARVTLELPLFINYAKHIHHQANDFKKFILRHQLNISIIPQQHKRFFHA